MIEVFEMRRLLVCLGKWVGLHTYLYRIAPSFLDRADEIAAAQVLGTRDDPSPVYAAILTAYRLAVLGDFDMFELEGLDTPFIGNGDGEWWPEDPEMSSLYVPVHAWFYVVTFAIGLFLFNILVSSHLG